MPNWCECDLTVEGTARGLREFLEFCGERFKFDRFIPYPEEYRVLDEAARRWDEQCEAGPENCRGPRPKDGFNQGGYEWCIENWGTKWDARRVVMPAGPTDGDDGPDALEIEITFETAWAPPWPVILAASKRFPALAFDLRYFERGQGFNGWLRCEGGEVVVDESGDYFGSRGG